MGDFRFFLSTATSPPIGGSLVYVSLSVALGFSLSRWLSSATSLSVSLSTLLWFLSLDGDFSFHRWISGFSLSLGGSSLDGDRTPSRCLSSKVKPLLCSSIMHVFRLCMFFFWSILHVFLICLSFRFCISVGLKHDGEGRTTISVALLRSKGKASDSCCSILKILICLWCSILSVDSICSVLGWMDQFRIVCCKLV